MSPQEMHALEKAALDDPFLADALEGYTGQTAVSADISELRERLAGRISEKQNKVIPVTRPGSSFSWWKMAAMIVLIAGAGLIVYQFGFNKKINEIAQAPQKEQAKSLTTDSGTRYSPVTQADSQIHAENKIADQKNNPGSKPTKDKLSKHANEPSPLRSETAQARAKETETAAAPAIPDITPGIATEKAEEQTTDSTHDIASATRQNNLRTRNQQEEIRAKAARARAVQDVEGFVNNNYNKPNVFRGRVTDAYNNALPFSNIINIRDSVGTYADANGFFNLISPDSVLNVKVSSIGFEPNTVELYNNIPANRIRLEEDKTSLAEVVISNKKINSNRAANNNMVLQDAEPADGWPNYDLYLANNLKEPDDLKEKKKDALHGEVELSFEVSSSGEPVNITVKKSLCEACDKEAIRVLKEGPRWKRKARKGKTTVTISF